MLDDSTGTGEGSVLQIPLTRGSVAITSDSSLDVIRYLIKVTIA